MDTPRQPIPINEILEDLKKQATATKPQILPLPKEWERTREEQNLPPVHPTTKTQLPLAFPSKINELSREEIADIRRAHEPITIHCKWCDKEIRARADQKFCCAKCRTAYFHAGARKLHEARMRAEAAWRAERDDLIRENSDLRHQLTELRKRLDP